MPIDTRHIELAADFCKVAGKANLVEYLGLGPSASAEEVQEGLRRRRKYMQGMQANPKYKLEAVQFIKNFATFQALLADPQAYLARVASQTEQAHVPLLEMTIKSAMRGGELSQEQVDYLKRNANQLGIGDETFIGTLHRLVADAGGKLPGQAAPLPPSGARTISPAAGSDEVNHADLYFVLGVSRNASPAQIRDAFQERLQNGKMLPRPEAERLFQRVQAAYEVLADPVSRESYDLAHTSTGPPARNREVTDPGLPTSSSLHAPTAPPVRKRSVGPKRQGAEEYTPVGIVPGPVGPRKSQPLPDEVEIRGAAVRQIRIGSASEITLPLFVVFHGDPAPGARLSTDEVWLTAQPTRLDGGLREQEVLVRIDAKGMASATAQGSLTVQTDRGARATVQFDVVRTNSTGPWIAVAVGIVVLIVAAIVWWVTIGSGS